MWVVDDGVADDDDNGVALLVMFVVFSFFSASRCWSLELRN